MAETAAHLTEHVIPQLPVRWQALQVLQVSAIRPDAASFCLWQTLSRAAVAQLPPKQSFVLIGCDPQL